MRNLNGTSQQLISTAALFGALAGAFLLVDGLFSIKEDWRARSWPAVDGTIRSVENFQRDTSLGQAGHSNGWFSHIRYAYQYDGVPHQYDRMYFNSPGSQSPFYYSVSFGANFHAGDRVTVFVNPSDPREAVLDKSLARPLAQSLLGIALIGVCTYHLAYLKSRNAQPRPLILPTAAGT